MNRAIDPRPVRGVRRARPHPAAAAPRRRARALLLCAAAAVPWPAAAQQPHLDILAGKLQDELAAIAQGTPGVFGVQVIDLATGQRIGVNDTLVFPQGSAIKVPILIELFRQASAGELSLDERVTIARAQAVGGSGYLQHFRDGSSALSLHDLAVMMITISDNMATNLLIERVGMANVNRTMAALGAPHTKLQRRMIQPQESVRGNENLATPAEAASLMARIHACDLPMGAEHCRALRDVLEIPHAGPIADAVPGGVVVGQKTGTITGVAVNWGYVDLRGRPYVIAAMGNYGDSARIAQAIRDAATAAHEYFRRLQDATVYGTRVRQP